MASTIFDLPLPFGPTIAVKLAGKENTILLANDLNPKISSDLIS